MISRNKRGLLVHTQMVQDNDTVRQDSARPALLSPFRFAVTHKTHTSALEVGETRRRRHVPPRQLRRCTSSGVQKNNREMLNDEFLPKTRRGCMTPGDQDRVQRTRSAVRSLGPRSRARRQRSSIKRTMKAYQLLAIRSRFTKPPARL